MGIFAPKSISVGDLFAGAIIPGLCLVGLYLGYILVRVIIAPQSMPPAERTEDVALAPVLGALAPPLLLIVAVLGSILGGYATPTEAAGVGAFGALLLGLSYGRINQQVLSEVRQCDPVHHRHGVFHSSRRIDFLPSVSRLRR